MIFKKYKVKCSGTKSSTLQKATSHSAGYDLPANLGEDVVVEINPGERKIIPTGIYLDMPADLEAQVRSRSGLCANHGLMVANGIGTIDSDYKEEIKVILYNMSDTSYSIKDGFRIAQLVFCELPKIELTVSRNGGFGSTGR